MDPIRLDMAHNPTIPHHTPSSSQPSDLQRFTAAGRPISYAPTSGIGSTRTFATAGSLPTRFTDDSVISVPIRLSDLQDPTSDFDAWWDSATREAKARPKGIRRLARSLLLRDRVGAKQGEFVLVRMTRGEYLRYCAKDERGRYVGTEPMEESRRALREMVRRREGERRVGSVGGGREVEEPRMGVVYEVGRKDGGGFRDVAELGRRATLG